MEGITKETFLKADDPRNRGCLVPWCDKNHKAKGYCDTHYYQTLRYKAILLRTNVTPNEFFLEGDICRISLYNRKRKKIAEAIIDTIDIDLCKSKKWCLVNGYVVSAGSPTIKLQNFLFGRKGKRSIVVDHIDGCKLNNRRNNLRICTQTQNNKNAGIRCDNTLGIKGVSYCKTSKKWRAYISINKIQKSLGYFSNKAIAVIVRQIAERKFYGEYARIK